MKWTNSLKNTLPKLIQGEVDKMNRPISTKEVESISNNLPEKRAPGSEGLTGEFKQIFKEK